MTDDYENTIETDDPPEVVAPLVDEDEPAELEELEPIEPQEPGPGNHRP